ncbi:MAG: PrsW family intramembrane metalloprotease [Chloroflexi bacterium]|nr:PrsW family intramembrane metalloprotease [Chloroflexota bacterium]
MTILLSIIAAVVPTIIYLLVLWQLDRYEKEPLVLFLAAFVWGAVPAVIASLILEVIGEYSMVAMPPLGRQLVGAGLVAPIVEEASKSAALLVLYWVFRHEFDGVLDGIIYGAVVGFGFAMTENVFYFESAWAEQGVKGFLMLVLMRAGVFGLNHAMFTGIAGAGIGLARLQHSRLTCVVLILLGFGGAVVAHMAHNILVAAQQACLLGTAADWGGVVALFVMIVLMWKHERNIIKTYLADEVGISLSAEQYAALAAFRPTRPAGLPTDDQTRARWQAWHQLSLAATELAFKKHQRDTTSDGERNEARIAELRRQINEYNRVLS